MGIPLTMKLANIERRFFMESIISKVGKMALAMILSLSVLTIPVSAQETYQPGANVVKDENSPSGYTVHFVYDGSQSEKEIESVSVSGPFRYVDANQELKDDTNSYTPHQFKNGMYASNCAPGSTNPSFWDTCVWGYTEEMLLNEDTGYYETAFPITSGSFGYHYIIKYVGEDETVTIGDPANPAQKMNENGFKNTGDIDTSIVCGHWDAVKQSNSPNMDYVLPTASAKGNLEYVAYTGIDGLENYIGVYTPANYDANRTEPYKVIYISHGAGGDETDWYHMGSIDNIMDNYVEQGLAEPAIIVTMDNSHFNWDTTKTLPNIVENIIPFMEEHYNVSKEASGRAMCGLSAGGMTTTNMYWTYPEVFGYFGIFSGTSVSEDLEWKAEYALPTIMATVGTCDFASSNLAGESSFTVETFDTWAKENIPDTYVTEDIYVKGSHDWFEWPQSFAMFIKDVAWINETSDYPVGVSVEENTNLAYVAPYQATFVYEDNDDRNAVSVQLTGGFQFYKPEEVGNYDAAGDNSAIPSYNAYEYQEGMFASGYGINGDSAVYELSQTTGERFEITIPLPANLYYYDYIVHYSDGTSENIQDPANKSEANVNGHDAGHSLLYVGNSSTAMSGQENVYARDDENTGSYSFVTYNAIDGTKQPLGIYLPNHYSTDKTYKTIYVSHGGGGNEAEWMTIGAIPNIMDNLIADGEIAEAIVVTMDNTYLGWDYEKIVPNTVENIIPFIEANYSVSHEAKDRAFCGLSMGSMTTNTMLRDVPNEFGYYGAFSGGNADLDPTHYDADAIKNATLYLTAGCIDMAYNNNMGISSVDFLKMLDDLGIDYTWELKNGAHDWYVWRDSFTTFAKDILWDVEKTPIEPDQPTPVVPDDTQTTPTDTNKPVTATDVNTGDYTNVFGFIGLAGVAMAAGAYLVIKKRKEN